MTHWLIVDDVPNWFAGERAIVDQDGTTVCNPSPMGEANARLIAQAPAMLEALELLVNGCTRVIGHDSTGQDMVKIRAAAIEKARAVIAQATGEKA